MPENEVQAIELSDGGKLEQLRLLLAPFLSANPYSSIESMPNIPDSTHVSDPWGDSSLLLRISKDQNKTQELANALNNLILPERYSAVYHKDLRSLEILWSALTLSERYSDIFGRKFEFVYEGSSYPCKFASSSERVLTIAEFTIPLEVSETNFRNLQSYILYADIELESRGAFSETGPVSFWIENLDYNDELESLITNLNFYLRYYDHQSPIVLVHDTVKSGHTDKKNRYLKGMFPKKIVAKPLDENLLSFWNFTGREPNQNPMINFILYYRIIEYAAFHYIDSKIRAELKRIITAPDFDAHSISTIDNIVGTFGVKNLEDISRFRSIIRNCVRPKALWPDVQLNLPFFSKDTKFDGGFVVKALITSRETSETFDHSRIEAFSESIRKIRNTLSHGKDQETSGIITPTLNNFNLLRPWLHLIATAAGEVVLTKDIT